MNIPSFKASPDDFAEFIKIVGENPKNKSKITIEIQEYLKNKSKRSRTISARNAINAIALPSLKKLSLIRGSGNNIELNENGVLLYKAIREGNHGRFVRLFSKLIIEFDKNEVHLLNLLSTFKKQFTFIELLKLARENGYESVKGDDKLSKWLNFLVYSGALIREGNQFRITNIEINLEKPKVTDSEFLQVLLNTYTYLNTRFNYANYVPVPKLRSILCEKFSKNGFMSYDFDEYLIKLYEKDTLKIVFSKPGKRVYDGLRVGKNYYYYVSIYNES